MAFKARNGNRDSQNLLILSKNQIKAIMSNIGIGSEGNFQQNANWTNCDSLRYKIRTLKGTILHTHQTLKRVDHSDLQDVFWEQLKL